MTWTLHVAKRAARAVVGAPDADRLRILDVLHQMCADPFSGDIHRLQGRSGLWRRRIGDWRIFFRVNRQERVVDLIAVVRRTSTTY
jgi:mRNA-degrading endonuclease RelE of RelBE toxin-antitoxin system